MPTNLYHASFIAVGDFIYKLAIFIIVDLAVYESFAASWTPAILPTSRESFAAGCEVH